MIDIGASRTLIRETMQMMIDLGMIHEIKENHYKVIRCEANI